MNKLGSNLLFDITDTINSTDQKKYSNEIDGKRIEEVNLIDIQPDPEQPRKNIDPDSEDIRELAESIKEHGFIHFITVRPEKDRKYVIITGERRFCAAKKLGLEKIPVAITSQSEVNCALIQLEENIHRQDLSPLEEAAAYERFVDEFGKQQKDIVNLIKKPKSYVSQMMSINKLSPEIKNEIGKKDIAKKVLWDLATLSEEDQKATWEKIKKEPTIASLEGVKQTLQKKKSSKPQLDEKELEEAIEWAYKQQKISKYMPLSYRNKLIQEFRENLNQ